MKKRRNIKKWFKDNKKIIFTVLLLLVAISILSSFGDNSVFARLTHEDEIEEPGGISDFLGSLIGNLLNMGSGVLGVAFTTLVTVIAALIFLVLYTVFGTLGMSDGFTSFPFPDAIIFNRLSFFDPNFINPTTVYGKAPVYLLQGIISSMYYTFFIIALTIFVIAAMVIGIKLAISSIASEKAQYKQALNNWVFGIALLFTVHILMAGIFALNEAIVEVAYDLAGNITFKMNAVKAIPLVGNTISNLLGTVSDILGKFGVDASLELNIDMKGFSGLVLMYMWYAIGGDFISSLVLCIVLGQTVALVVMYTKRLFYCIFLGMLAPLIVAVDVIRKSM